MLDPEHPINRIGIEMSEWSELPRDERRNKFLERLEGCHLPPLGYEEEPYVFLLRGAATLGSRSKEESGRVHRRINAQVLQILFEISKNGIDKFIKETTRPGQVFDALVHLSYHSKGAAALPVLGRLEALPDTELDRIPSWLTTRTTSSELVRNTIRNIRERDGLYSNPSSG